jgi:transcriptional regulator with XRE-family HTH domain
MANERWKLFGSELRRLRIEAGYTQQQLGSRAGLSPAMVGALERASRVPRADYADVFDTLLATGGVLSRVWQDASSRREVPHWFQDALALERRARVIREFEILVVPGLLQTTDYARALETASQHYPDAEKVEQLVTRRTGRWSNLREDLATQFVIPAGVLRYVIGTPEVMADQMMFLQKRAQEDGVRIQILENAPGLAARYPFRLMTLNQQPVAYVEHADGGSVVDHPDRVRTLEEVFHHLQAESLPSQESLTLIRKMGEIYESTVESQ